MAPGLPHHPDRRLCLASLPSRTGFVTPSRTFGAVRKFAEGIQQPPQALGGYWYPQRCATVEHRHAAPESRRAGEGDGAHLVRVEMVQHFEHRRAAVDGHRERAVQRWQRLAGDIHHRAVDLDDMADGGARRWHGAIRGVATYIPRTPGSPASY